MPILKTHSHTSERSGYEARENGKKVIERNADTIRRQTSRQNLPRTATLAVGARRKRRYSKTNHRQNPPPYRTRGWGGRNEETQIEGEHRLKDKGNQNQKPPAGCHRGGGGETKGENQHEMERWHNQQSREGGKCLAENA